MSRNNAARHRRLERRRLRREADARTRDQAFVGPPTKEEHETNLVFERAARVWKSSANALYGKTASGRFYAKILIW